MKCIVKDCPNHEHEGKFMGNLCSPCAEFIANGKTSMKNLYSQAYRNVQKAVEEEREACAKVADAWQTQVLDPQYHCDCATAIRRRGDK